MAVSQARASDMAMELLVALIDDPEDLERFMTATGLRPADLRAAASHPDIALSLLDFVVEEDDRIGRFATALRVSPQDIMAARTALSGPGSYGWEAD